MPKASLFAGTVLLSAVTAILATGSRADDKRTLTVTAVTHDARVNDRTSYHTKPGQSTTDCTGTGSDPADTGTVRINMDCNTTTTPPTTSSITTRTTDVSEKVIDSEGMVYTIACTDRPSIFAAAIVGAAAGGGASGGNTTLSGRGKCIPLKDGDQFDAEIKDTTMWVLARRGGNQGKAVKIKYKILDIRKEMPLAPMGASSPATATKDDCDVNEVWSLGRSLGEKDNEIADAIKQQGVCKVLFFLRGEADAKAQAASSPQSQPQAQSLPSSAPIQNSRQSASSDSYAGIGGGHWIREVSNNGAIVTLEDGSLWEISTVDRVDTALWLAATNITVLKSQSPAGDYKYTLINKDDGEKAAAKYLGKE